MGRGYIEIGEQISVEKWWTIMQTNWKGGLRKSFSKNIMKVYLVTLKMHKTEIVETRVVEVSLLCIFLFSVIMWPVVIKIWCGA